MKVYKFHNETFETTLEVVFISSKNKKDCDRVVKRALELDIDQSMTKDLIDESLAFCSNMRSGNVVLMIFNIDSFKEGAVQKLTALQHECNHFRQAVLDWMGEPISQTDLEAHLRLSDWAFKKCMSTKFFKSLLK